MTELSPRPAVVESLQNIGETMPVLRTRLRLPRDPQRPAAIPDRGYPRGNCGVTSEMDAKSFCLPIFGTWTPGGTTLSGKRATS